MCVFFVVVVGLLTNICVCVWCSIFLFLYFMFFFFCFTFYYPCVCLCIFCWCCSWCCWCGSWISPFTFDFVTVALLCPPLLINFRKLYSLSQPRWDRSCSTHTNSLRHSLTRLIQHYHTTKEERLGTRGTVHRKRSNYRLLTTKSKNYVDTCSKQRVVARTHTHAHFAQLHNLHTSFLTLLVPLSGCVWVCVCVLIVFMMWDVLGFCSFELHAYEERVLRGFLYICVWLFVSNWRVPHKGGRLVVLHWLLLLLLGVVLLEGGFFCVGFFPVGDVAAWDKWKSYPGPK